MVKMSVRESSQSEQFHHNHASPLTQRLYLAAARAISSRMLIELGITCLINATLELPTITYHLRDCLQIAVEDRIGCRLSVYFDVVADKIHSVHESSGEDKIVIYCRAGMSRSASLCIAYFMKYHAMSFEEAFGYVKRRRPIIHPNVGFVRQLRDYEQRLRGKAINNKGDQGLQRAAECIVVDHGNSVENNFRILRPKLTVNGVKARRLTPCNVKEHLRQVVSIASEQALDCEMTDINHVELQEAERRAFVSFGLRIDALTIEEQVCVERTNSYYQSSECSPKYNKLLVKRHVVKRRALCLPNIELVNTWIGPMAFETRRFPLNQLMRADGSSERQVVKRVKSIRLPGLRLGARIEKRSKMLVVHTDNAHTAVQVEQQSLLLEHVDQVHNFNYLDCTHALARANVSVERCHGHLVRPEVAKRPTIAHWPRTTTATTAASTSTASTSTALDLEVCYASERYVIKSLRLQECEEFEPDEQLLASMEPHYTMESTNGPLTLEFSNEDSKHPSLCGERRPLCVPEIDCIVSVYDEEVLSIPQIQDGGDLSHLRSMILSQSDFTKVNIWLSIFEAQIVTSRAPLQPFVILTELLFVPSIAQHLSFDTTEECETISPVERQASMHREEQKELGLTVAKVQHYEEMEHVFVFYSSKPTKFFPKICFHDPEKNHVASVSKLEVNDHEHIENVLSRANVIADNELNTVTIQLAVDTFWFFDITAPGHNNEDTNEGHVQVYMPDPDTATSLRRRATLRLPRGSAATSATRSNSQTRLATSNVDNTAMERAKLRTLLDYAQHCLWSRSSRSDRHYRRSRRN